MLPCRSKYPKYRSTGTNAHHYHLPGIGPKVPTREHVREYSGMNRQQIMAELIVIHLQDHQNKRALSRSSSWWDKFYIYCTELYTELLKKIELPVMNMANRAITRTFTDSNCFSYLLSLSLSLQCLVVSLKVPSSCTSLISGFFFSLKGL